MTLAAWFIIGGGLVILIAIIATIMQKDSKLEEVLANAEKKKHQEFQNKVEDALENQEEIPKAKQRPYRLKWFNTSWLDFSRFKRAANKVEAVTETVTEETVVEVPDIPGASTVEEAVDKVLEKEGVERPKEIPLKDREDIQNFTPEQVDEELSRVEAHLADIKKDIDLITKDVTYSRMHEEESTPEIQAYYAAQLNAAVRQSFLVYQKAYATWTQDHKTLAKKYLGDITGPTVKHGKARTEFSANASDLLFIPIESESGQKIIELEDKLAEGEVSPGQYVLAINQLPELKQYAYISHEMDTEKDNPGFTVYTVARKKGNGPIAQTPGNASSAKSTAKQEMAKKASAARKDKQKKALANG